MKKILILILIVLLIVLCCNIVINGYTLGSIKILGLNEIQNKNENLDKKIAEVQDLKEIQYPKQISELVENSNKLKTTKKEYEELVAYSSEQDVLRASQAEKYDVEVLWVRIGNHAEKRNVVPTLEVLNSSNNTTGANDLRITAVGRYIGISDFVRDLEDDAKLEFTIENFEMVPVDSGDGTELKATFKVKDIFLDQDSMTSDDNDNDNDNEDITDDNTKDTATKTKTTNKSN